MTAMSNYAEEVALSGSPGTALKGRPGQAAVAKIMSAFTSGSNSLGGKQRPGGHRILKDAKGA
jgi:hypothetical protein